jgi:hypothetical protein
MSTLNPNKIIILARKHLGSGTMESSARLCLSDALALVEKCDFRAASDRALRSLAYSVGIGHPDYSKAWKAAGKTSPVALP